MVTCIHHSAGYSGPQSEPCGETESLRAGKHLFKLLRGFDRRSLCDCLVSPSHLGETEGVRRVQATGAAHYCCYRFRYSNKCLVQYEKKVTLPV